MKICATCDGRVKNTGAIRSVKPFDVTQGGYLVPLNDDDGNRNFLDLSAADLDAELLGKVNEEDPSKRWYPLRNLKNVTHEEADDTYETDDSNQRFKVLDGIKTFSAEIWGATHTFFAHIEGQCVPFGFVPNDKCGNLLGEVEGDNFYPRLVNSDSYSAQYMNKTATTSAKATFQFDWDLLSSDGYQEMLSVESFDVINPASLEGLLDVNIVLDANTAAGSVDIDMFYDYGSILNKKKFTGADMTNFTVNNVTQGTPIAVDTITDNGGGNYTLNYVVGDVPTTNDEVSIDYFDAATGNLVNGFEGVQMIYTSI